MFIYIIYANIIVGYNEYNSQKKYAVLIKIFFFTFVLFGRSTRLKITIFLKTLNIFLFPVNSLSTYNGLTNTKRFKPFFQLTNK